MEKIKYLIIWTVVHVEFSQYVRTEKIVKFATKGFDLDQNSIYSDRIGIKNPNENIVPNIFLQPEKYYPTTKKRMYRDTDAENKLNTDDILFYTKGIKKIMSEYLETIMNKYSKNNKAKKLKELDDFFKNTFQYGKLSAEYDVHECFEGGRTMQNYLKDSGNKRYTIQNEKERPNNVLYYDEIAKESKEEYVCLRYLEEDLN